MNALVRTSSITEEQVRCKDKGTEYLMEGANDTVQNFIFVLILQHLPFLLHFMDYSV